MSAIGVAQMRLERLNDERTKKQEMVATIRTIAEEDGGRELNEPEQEQILRHREEIARFDEEIEILCADIESFKRQADVSQALRVNERPAEGEGTGSSVMVYRTFAQYARDELIARYPMIAGHVGDDDRQRAVERLQRAIQNTTTSEIEGLLPPQHMAQIMDLINSSRPVVRSARNVDLSRGKLTYPKIKQRPEVTKQSSEKQEAGTANMQIDMEDLTADTYLGGGDLSWQAINWSTPDALQLWFDLASEAYARATETAACAVLEAAGTASGTVSPSLGTAGTEDFAAWRAGVLAGLAGIDSNTASRSQTDTLYVSMTRFYQAAGLGTNATLQMAPVGQFDIGARTGTFLGLRVIGSYGFSDANTAILGDSSAFLVGETPGAPVQLRAVEPAIGGMEVGVIGAFAAAVFDTDRFIFLS